MSNKSSSVVIKSNNPIRQKIVWSLVLLLASIGLGLVYHTGYRSGFDDFEKMTFENAALAGEKEVLEKELEDLALRFAVVKHGEEITRTAAEEVRVSNKMLRAELLELEELLAFYRGVMNPDKNKRGLQIERFNLEQTGERRFRYHMTLAQVADHRRYIEGSVYLKLIGEKDGKKSDLQLYLKINDEDKKKARFRFRYFQKFNGEVVLSPEFLPSIVKVTAKSKGRHAVKITREFDWVLQEG